MNAKEICAGSLQGVMFGQFLRDINIFEFDTNRKKCKQMVIGQEFREKRNREEEDRRPGRVPLRSAILRCEAR